MSSEANEQYSQGDEFPGGPPLLFNPGTCQPTKAEADALKKDKRRGTHMVNLILQCGAMRPAGEVVEVILPDDLDEEDYFEGDESLYDEGMPDLSKMLPNSDNNPIEYIHTRDTTGGVDSRYKQAPRKATSKNSARNKILCQPGMVDSKDLHESTYLVWIDMTYE